MILFLNLFFLSKKTKKMYKFISIYLGSITIPIIAFQNNKHWWEVKVVKIIVESGEKPSFWKSIFLWTQKFKFANNFYLDLIHFVTFPNWTESKKDLMASGVWSLYHYMPSKHFVNLYRWFINVSFICLFFSSSIF